MGSQAKGTLMVIAFFSRKTSAVSISVDTTGFNHALGPTDDTVQQAFDTLDDHIQSPDRGGTGIINYATGDIIYADATDHLDRLPAGAEDRILKIISGIPAWDDKIDGGTY